MITASLLADLCTLAYAKPGPTINWRTDLADDLHDAGIYLETIVDFADCQGFVCTVDNNRITVFRGTDSFSEIITNFMCRTTPSALVPGTKTHRIFEDHAQTALGIIERKVNYLDGARDYFCGHSLGGAIAAILALHVKQAKKKRHSSSITNLITFEAPKAGGKSFSTKLAREVPHARIQVAGDIVPLLPPWPLYHHDGLPAYFDATGAYRPGAGLLTRTYEHGRAMLKHVGVPGFSGIAHHSMKSVAKKVCKEDDDGQLLIDWLDL